MGDIITRLLLKTNDFDANLNRAKGSVSSFQGGIEGMASKASAGLMKLAGTVGLAVTAYEGFNKLMQSSQTLSDEYNRTLDGLKGGVDQFFYSLGSGDWTPFFNGLDETIRKAREAYNAMDQLGNTKISFGYFNMKNQAEYQKQITIIKDKDSTPEQKAEAKKILDATLKDQSEIVGQLKRRSGEAMRALVAESTGIGSADVSMMSVERTLRLDVSAMGDAEKKRLAKEYKDFQEIAKRERVKATTYEMVETGAGMSKGWTKVDHVDMDAYNKAMAPVLAKYQDAVVYNGVLVKKSDEWLQNLTGIASESFAAEQAYESMVKSANRATQSGRGGNGPKKEIIPADSIAEIDSQLSALNKKLVQATTMEARASVQATINELEQKKVNIKVVVEQEVFKSKYGEMKDGELSGPVFGTSGYKPSSKLTLSDAGEINPPIKKEDIELNKLYAESLGGIGSMMGTMSGMFDSSTASILQWGASFLSTIAQVVPQLATLAAANKAETSTEVAGAAAKTMNAHAKIPFVGIAMGLAAVASIFSVMSQANKFATGGIVPGGSFSGDKVPAFLNSGEMILNSGQQGNLFRLLNAGTPSVNMSGVQSLAGGAAQKVEVSGDVRVRGTDISIALQNTNNQKNKIR